MSRDPIDQVDETDTDTSECIDYQVITVDTKTNTETGGNTSQRPDH